MDTVKEFAHQNPDIPAKLTATTLAFCVLILCAWGSLLTSLALTFLYITAYAVILYFVREHRILDLNNFDEPYRDSDGEDYYGSDEDISPALGMNDNGRVFSPNFAEKSHSFVHAPENRLQFRTSLIDGERMSAFRPTRSYRTGAGISPASDFLSANRSSLSREPLKPAVINTPISSGFGQNLIYRGHAKQIAGGLPRSNSLGQSRVPLVSSPQTSSPFHNKSQVGLWDTMGMSAIASSDEFISPIGSPAREHSLNRSSPYLSSPSPSMAPKPGYQPSHAFGQPVHSTGHPIGSKRQVPSAGNAPSSQWQRWTQRQTAVRVSGRPRLQSPVMVRIAQPDKGPATLTPDTRYLSRLLVQQKNPPDSLRKDVILSALRDKRKRGKAGPDENDTTSPDQSSMDGGSHLKKRRLNNADDSDLSVREPLPSKRRQRPQRPLETPRVVTAKRPNSALAQSRDDGDQGEGEADTVLDTTAASTSFHRNAIVSSFSSAKILTGRSRKRDHQSDDKVPAHDMPPKKVSKSTDVSGLVSENEDNVDDGKRKRGSAASMLDSSQEEEGAEPRKASIAPRVRKRAVFTSVHRGKQTKPPSPQQVTAADLHEDRERALERSRQMRMLLRDDSAKPKEQAKESDKPLLPVAKTSTATPLALPSFPAVTPLSIANTTVIDSGTTKASTSASGNSLLDNLLKEDPLTKKLAKQASQKDKGQGKSAAASGGLGLFGSPGLATPGTPSPLSTSVTAPVSTKSPLLQALTGMKGATTAAASSGPSATGTSATPVQPGLGLVGPSAFPLASKTASLPTSSSISFGGSSVQPSATTSSVTFNLGGSSGDTNTSGSIALTSSAPATTQPGFQFGSGSFLQQSAETDQTDLQKTTASPFTFGAPSISQGTGLVTSQIPASQPPTTLPPAYGSSQASSGTLAPSSNIFGGNSASQPAATTGMFSFGGSANPPPTAKSSTVTSMAFGAPKPSFAFGQSTTPAEATNSQPTAPTSSLFAFSGGSTTAAASSVTAATTSAATTGMFSFGAPAGAATPSSAPLFQSATPVQAPTTAASPFTFGGASSAGVTTAKPAFGGFGSQANPSSTGNTAAPTPAFNFGGQTTSSALSTSNTTAVKPAFNFGGQPASSASAATKPPAFNFGGAPTPSASSGFAFGGQQNKPAATQPSLFPAATSQTASSGFSFGAPATPAKTLFPSAAPQQRTVPSFGSQSAAGTPTFGASASAPSLDFGGRSQGMSTGAAMTASPFQFGGAAATPNPPQQQQSAPAFNFSGAAKPSTFAFGAAPSTPQFGQGTPAATPPRAAGSSFSMGSSQAPRKASSARMRHRARAGRK